MSKKLVLATLSVVVGAALSVAYLMEYLPTQIGEPIADIKSVAQEEPEQALEQPASEETTLVPVKEADAIEEIEPPAEPVNILGAYEYFDEEGISAEDAGVESVWGVNMLFDRTISNQLTPTPRTARSL